MDFDHPQSGGPHVRRTSAGEGECRVDGSELRCSHRSETLVYVSITHRTFTNKRYGFNHGNRTWCERNLSFVVVCLSFVFLFGPCFCLSMFVFTLWHPCFLFVSFCSFVGLLKMGFGSWQVPFRS